MASFLFWKQRFDIQSFPVKENHHNPKTAEAGTATDPFLGDIKRDSSRKNTAARWSPKFPDLLMISFSKKKTQQHLQALYLTRAVVGHAVIPTGPAWTDRFAL